MVNEKNINYEIEFVIKIEEEFGKNSKEYSYAKSGSLKLGALLGDASEDVLSPDDLVNLYKKDIALEANNLMPKELLTNKIK